MRLLVGTGNRGKQQEIARLLPDLQVVTPGELGLEVEVDETGATFAANAALKAHAYAAAAGCVALADDSGLEVDALQGAPGVRSARFGGPGLSDRQRCDLLLERLAALPADTSRQARFRCCVVVAAPDGRSCTASGVLEGRITCRPRGAGGFGYDPVFLLPERGLTLAEMPLADKNEVSHRARALRQLLPLLHQTFPELAAAARADAD